MVALFAFNSMAKIGFAQICECPRLGIIIAQRRRNEDRKRVAGGQDYEVRYESKQMEVMAELWETLASRLSKAIR